MRKLISTFIKYPIYANIIIAVLVFGGGFSLMNMRLAFFPERSSRNIYISVFYPGASPKEMDEGVTSRIEDAVRAIVGIKQITSTSSENSSFVNIETTGEYDIDEMLVDVKNAVDAISSMPTAAERPIIYKKRSVTQAMYMTIAGDADLETLKKHAYDIEADFLRSGFVSQISIRGFPAIEISIEVTEETLLKYNLTFDEISRAVALNNTDISGGMIKSDEHEILIRSRSRNIEPSKIGEIIVRANPDGSFLRIRDIANIKRKFADVSNKLRYNGKEAIQISVNKLANEDLQKISEYIHDYVDKFNKSHSDVKMYINFDFLSMLRSRLELLYRNGGTGLILVLLMLALFLNVRLSFWVAWGIPSAFLAMFIVANLYGITINMISLFGMILVIGILVDDGIVIGENIFSHFEKGKTPMRAALDGTMEVVPAVVTSVVTTIVAFAPLLLITEGGMEFMFEMAFVVIFSLLFSLGEAFFVLPAHLSSKKVLNRIKGRSKFRTKIDKGIAYLREKIYGKSLKFTIKWKWVAFFTPLALIIITVGLYGGGFIKATTFPALSFDSFTVDFAFKPGDGAKRTDEYLKKFDKLIWEVNDELMKEYNDTSTFIDYTFQILGSSFDALENGSHAGSIMVGLRDMEGAPITSFDIRNRISKKLGKHPELERLRVAAKDTHWGSPISVTLLGKDQDELTKAKKFLKEKLQEIEGLQNISDNNAAGMQEILIKLKPKAYFLGLNHNSISQQVRQGFYGGQAQRLQSGRDELRVWVRYPKSDRMTIGQFENMKIKTPLGNYPVSELIDFNIKRGPVQIKRYNGSREITIESGVTGPDVMVPPIMEKIQNEIVPELKSKFHGIEVDYRGQSKKSGDAMREMISFFIIAIVIIVIILILHFRSTWQALIILMMIPLGWLGGIWGHGVEGIPVSMLSFFGLVALSGVIINDAVVFLSKYNSLLLEGYKVEDAVYEAGLSRFRPIILTTITTSVGLYPIIFEKSFQAQMLIPMAVSLAYGVFIGTAFILMFFPVLILCLNDIRVYSRYLWTGKKPTNEEVEVVIKNSKRIIE
ncbi:MAG: efflux RND transporter permease subunit [Chlorobi bacterium]|nr:efflux RND transporter permease subunit [Chlorobiota bacterium]